jgi:hypothetical protein
MNTELQHSPSAPDDTDLPTWVLCLHIAAILIVAFIGSAVWDAERDTPRNLIALGLMAAGAFFLARLVLRSIGVL